MPTLISADDAATSAEEIYGSLQHIVKPILEKISLSTPTGTASLQPAYFSLVPTSLKKWYRRWLLLTKGKGRLIRPTRDKMTFISQHSLPIRCGLRSQLSLTSPSSRFSDNELADALRRVGLDSLPSRVGWDTEQDWPSVLSHGETRLLAIARVLLSNHRFVFLERMDGELTLDQIEYVYRTLSDAGISYITIGENDHLRAFHDTILELNGAGAWRILPVVETAAIKH